MEISSIIAGICTGMVSVVIILLGLRAMVRSAVDRVMEENFRKLDEVLREHDEIMDAMAREAGLPPFPRYADSGAPRRQR